MPNKTPILIAVDGTSASGKSSTSRALAKMLGFLYVDTGAMYRTLAWYCLKNKVNIDDARAVGNALRRWKTTLELVDGHVQLWVDGYFPEKEIRTNETSAAVSHIAAFPKVRDWMKKKQRECIQFGHLVMEGRDIGTNVFPETDFKFYLDASLAERTRRRNAEGVTENLAARDQRDSQRATAPLMVPLGAMVINNSGHTIEQTGVIMVEEIKRRLAARGDTWPPTS